MNLKKAGDKIINHVEQHDDDIKLCNINYKFSHPCLSIWHITVKYCREFTNYLTKFFSSTYILIENFWKQETQIHNWFRKKIKTCISCSCSCHNSPTQARLKTSAPNFFVKTRRLSRCLDTADRCLLDEINHQARLAGQIVSSSAGRDAVRVKSGGPRRPHSTDSFTSSDANAGRLRQLTPAPVPTGRDWSRWKTRRATVDKRRHHQEKG